MYVLRTILNWGWCPILITALALVGYIYEWPIEALAISMGIILIIGLAVAASNTREKELERTSQRLRQLAGYFNRRFMGNASLSIFTVINSLSNTDSPRIWEWIQGCGTSQRVFNTWGSSFINRVESDIRIRRFNIYLQTYLNELWLITSHYYNFVEQFYDVAEKIEIPQETADQYHRFVMEYNAFVQDFREYISQLKKVARTEIEPPSIKLALELPETKTLEPTQKTEAEPPPPPRRKGYIL